MFLSEPVLYTESRVIFQILIWQGSTVNDCKTIPVRYSIGDESLGDVDEGLRDGTNGNFALTPTFANAHV